MSTNQSVIQVDQHSRLFWIYGWQQQCGLMLGVTSVVFYFHSQMIWDIAVIWWQSILAQYVIVFLLTFFDIMYTYST